MNKQGKELALLLSLPALDGCILTLAATGGLTRAAIPVIALTMISGPAAIAMAMGLTGSAMERIVIASFACVIASVMIISAAGIGSFLGGFIHLGVFKVFSGIVVSILGLMIIGLRFPQQILMGILGLGIVVSILWRVL